MLTVSLNHTPAVSLAAGSPMSSLRLKLYRVPICHTVPPMPLSYPPKYASLCQEECCLSAGP